MTKSLSYNEIALRPDYGVAASRSECSTEVEFLGYRFALPVMPANMKCSIDFKTAEWCIENRIPYVLHRFYPYEEIYDWIFGLRLRSKAAIISISLGVQQRDYDFLSRLADTGNVPSIITIDVAHGHSNAVIKMLDYFHNLDWKHNRPKIIAGNVTTEKAVLDLSKWGADAIKVGIGQGHVCTTRLETGFGMPMFSALVECSRASKIPIIADGGISQFGDAAKALVAGADMVMSGSMFARCIDSPADTEKPGILTGTYKRWYGSASEENKGQDKYVEGKCVYEETNYLTYEQLIRKWKEALQSAISYAGGRDLSAFNNVKFNIV
jgi:GMP reductase